MISYTVLLGQQALVFSTALLLLKLTIVLALVLILHACFRNKSATFKHAILASGLFVLPIVLVGHVYGPQWNVPVSASLMEEFAGTFPGDKNSKLDEILPANESYANNKSPKNTGNELGHNDGGSTAESLRQESLDAPVQVEVDAVSPVALVRSTQQTKDGVSQVDG